MDRITLAATSSFVQTDGKRNNIALNRHRHRHAMNRRSKSLLLFDDSSFCVFHLFTFAESTPIFLSLLNSFFIQNNSSATFILTCVCISKIGVDYLENNCAEEPNKLCEFKRLSGRILKTVDSVYQDVSNIDECRELCLNSPYRYRLKSIYICATTIFMSRI